MSLAFSWVDLPEGRARFCGLVRGSDELGREVFAVDENGRAGYGQIVRSYADRDISLEIVSFGYPDESQVGLPHGAAPYDEAAAELVERLVRQLIATVAAHEDVLDKPAILRMPATTRFTGEVRFRDGWVARTGVSSGASA